MKIKSYVLEDTTTGQMQGWKVYSYYGKYNLVLKPYLSAENYLPIEKKYVKSYEVINKESYTNATSAVLKGSIASAFFGAPGLLAGLSAKTDDAYWVAIEWVNGKKTLLQLNSEDYQLLIRTLF